jgi:Mg2+/Co2+ transporter CorB
VRFDGAQGYWVRADVTVRDLNRYLDWDLPEMFAKSVGGLALHELKSIPDGECSIIIGQYLVALASFRGNRLILFHISEILSQDE